MDEPDQEDGKIIDTLRKYIGGGPKGTRRSSFAMAAANQGQEGV